MANFPIHFHPLADDDAEGARAWYAERNAMAADLFVDDLDAAVERVCEAPERWPCIRGDVRRYAFRKFPFGLVYYLKNDVVEVIAVAHERRSPSYWQRRRRD